MTSVDTIVAQASAHGNGVRGIVRLSGRDSLRATERLFTPLSTQLDASESHVFDQTKPWVANGWFAPWHDESPEQKVRCALFYWPAGRGFTGEQAVELHLPGSPPVLDAAIRALCASGKARLANRGEFTLRAFLNGRLDLTQAEAILGAVDANSDAELKNALIQLSGVLSQKFGELRFRLLDVLSELEAGFDFSEEDVEFISVPQAYEKISQIAAEIDQALQNSKQNLIRNHFPRVLLVGRPNVGKSSLFNALVEHFQGKTAGAALVTEDAGTTRDYLEAELTIDGVPFTLVDSAGLEREFFPKEKSEVLESRKLAQSVLHDEISRADLLLRCFDSMKSKEELEFDFYEIQSVSILDVVTKLDVKNDLKLLDCAENEPIRTSTATGEGIERLGRSVVEKLCAQMWDGEVVPATALRCQEALRQAGDSLHRALSLLENALCDETLVASELRIALDQIGLIAGQTHSDDLLDRIFSRFCIGK